MLTGKSREKLTAQVKDAAERIGSGVVAVLAVACLALAVASGALFISLKCLGAVRS